jgi:predicted MPP superfamily phosphohydrolase
VQVDLATAAAAPGDLRHHLLARLPLNEILRLVVIEWALDIPRLPAALDGLSIVHLSDLHLTGRVGKAYFREVVRTSNELQPDLVAVTGDIIENAACLPWLADTLGQLTARYGVCFILGNHDRRINFSQVRRTLVENGLIDLGNRRREVQIAGQPVILMGSEQPWMNGADGRVREMRQASRARETHQTEVVNDRCMTRSLQDSAPLRIALAHSPDQLSWACAEGADLLLAGHTHGGQICIPPLGAIISPTRSGVKHVYGVYHVPPTVLHVSRGISGDIPLRWNCPPEIARLRLHASDACGSV